MPFSDLYTNNILTLKVKKTKIMLNNNNNNNNNIGSY